MIFTVKTISRLLLSIVLTTALSLIFLSSCDYAESLGDRFYQLMPTADASVSRSSSAWVEQSSTRDNLNYYVRRSWDEPDTQSGAFEIWDNAVREADRKGLRVFSGDGVLLYDGNVPSETSASSTTVLPEPTAIAVPVAWDLSTIVNTRHGWSYPPDTHVLKTLAKYNAYAYGPGEDKTIYLTFNAGYEHNNNSKKILDILARHNVPAVFFVDGYYLNANTAIARRMLAEGHVIGNHTQSHGDIIGLLNTGNISAAEREVRAFEDLHLKITGQKAAGIFRPPSSEWSERMLALAQNLGYTSYLFSWTHKDWLTADQPDPAQTLAALKAQLFPGSLIMLHNVSDTNVSVLEAFIEYAIASAYHFSLLPY